ncbi:hypothetical protein MBLNU459_g7164t2 [Dothideomycetes sp. NU459]
MPGQAGTQATPVGAGRWPFLTSFLTPLFQVHPLLRRIILLPPMIGLSFAVAQIATTYIIVMVIDLCNLMDFADQLRMTANISKAFMILSAVAFWTKALYITFYLDCDSLEGSMYSLPESIPLHVHHLLLNLARLTVREPLPSFPSGGQTVAMEAGVEPLSSFPSGGQTDAMEAGVEPPERIGTTEPDVEPLRQTDTTASEADCWSDHEEPPQTPMEPTSRTSTAGSEGDESSSHHSVTSSPFVSQPVSRAVSPETVPPVVQVDPASPEAGADARRALEQEVEALKGQVATQTDAKKALQERCTAFIKNKIAHMSKTWVTVRFQPRRPGSTSELIDYAYADDSRRRVELHNRRTGAMNDTDEFTAFEFDRIFDEHSSNRDVFVEMEPVIECAIEGRNVCIIADGQSGTGKTHTMMNGGEGAVIPAAAELIFRRLGALEEQGKRLVVRCSIAEVYKGKSRDLLASVNVGTPATSTVHKVKARGHGPTLGEWPVTTARELLDLIELTQGARNVSQTVKNARSSRGHYVCKIVIVTRHSDELPSRTTGLFFVDLAGSEVVVQAKDSTTLRDEGLHIAEDRACLRECMQWTSKTGDAPSYKRDLTKILHTCFLPEARSVTISTVSLLKVNERATLKQLEYSHDVGWENTNQSVFGFNSLMSNLA